MPTQTLTLADFLLARIAEDEAVVEGFHQGDGDPDFMWGPDRIRAECAAKREIVADYLAAADDSDGPEKHAKYLAGVEAGLYGAVQHLALPYADHSDYRQEWRP